MFDFKLLEPCLEEILGRGEESIYLKKNGTYDYDSKEYINLDDKSYDPTSIPDRNVVFPSGEALAMIKARNGSQKQTDLNRKEFKTSIIEEDKFIFKELDKEFGKKDRYCSGLYHMPPGGTCVWHTNSNNTRERIYFVWCSKNNKSFFKYLNENNDVITVWEKSGWQINRFKPRCEEPLLWHCVGTETDRVSIGFCNKER